MTRIEAHAMLQRIREGITDDAWDDVVTALSGVNGAPWNRNHRYRHHPDMAHGPDQGCNKCDFIRAETLEHERVEAEIDAAYGKMP
jgi:hypothetical protein